MEKNNRIVQVIPSLTTGGAEKFVVDLCNFLVAISGNEVYLLSLRENEEEKSFISLLDSRINYISFGKGDGFNIQILWKIQNYIKQLEPDVVHTHTNAFEYVFPFRLLARHSRFVHTIHNKAEKECPNKMLKIIRKFFYKKNTVPVTISQDGSLTYKKYYKLNNDILIENGCPPVSTNKAERHDFEQDSVYTLIHVGRISPQKNQLLLVKAVNKFNLNAKGRKARLLIIGRASDELIFNQLKGVADPEYIQFLGERHDIGAFLGFADAFCLSSIFEGMPISLIEALSAGCIPVCTPVGAIPEMIENGKTGFLSTDLGVDSYCQALEQALSASKEEKEAIKKNCIMLFNSRYEISFCGRRYLDVYGLKTNPIR